MSKKKFKVHTVHEIGISHFVEAANKKKAVEFVAKHYRKQIPYNDPKIIFEYQNKKRYKNFFGKLENYNPSRNHLFRVYGATEYAKCPSCGEEGFIQMNCEDKCKKCYDKYVESFRVDEDEYLCRYCLIGYVAHRGWITGDCPICDEMSY